MPAKNAVLARNVHPDEAAGSLYTMYTTPLWPLCDGIARCASRGAAPRAGGGRGALWVMRQICAIHGSIRWLLGTQARPRGWRVAGAPGRVGRRSRQDGGRACVPLLGLMLDQFIIAELDADTAARGVLERLLGLLGEEAVLDTVDEEQSGYGERAQACQWALTQMRTLWGWQRTPTRSQNSP